MCADNNEETLVTRKMFNWVYTISLSLQQLSRSLEWCVHVDISALIAENNMRTKFVVFMGYDYL